MNQLSRACFKSRFGAPIVAASLLAALRKHTDTRRTASRLAATISLSQHVLVYLLLATRLPAATIVCDGVLGNSGAAGPTLVQFADKVKGRGHAGLGVVCDRFGSLWDRGGLGQLNRYALDGRLLATYPISPGVGRWDRLTSVGDTLVLLIDGKLFTLNVTAPSGAKPTALPVAAKAISYGACRGRLAGIDADRQLFLFDPVTGQTEPVLTVPFEDWSDLEMTSTGEIYFYGNQKLQKVVASKLVNDATWPRKTWGERENRPIIQWIDGVWFGLTGGGTIKRYGPDWQPDPGVVLGGASGWVIAALPMNREIGAGGMARVRDNLYAISGGAGVLHLLEWKPQDRKMEIIRRIGAFPNAAGLALDKAGHISTGEGRWEWNDSPATPYRSTDNCQFGGQVAMLDSGIVATPGFRYGNMPHWFAGSLATSFALAEFPFKQHWGGAVTRQQQVMLVEANGAARQFTVGNDGKSPKDFGAITLRTEPPVEKWTTLALKDAATLLAGADGQVIELRSAADNDWEEARRWRSWGESPAQSFGSTIFITAAAGRLWVADQDRHRVLCFELATGKLLATFGGSGAGSDLAHLSQPTTIAVAGERALVYDSGNQRLVKLRFQP